MRPFNNSASRRFFFFIALVGFLIAIGTFALLNPHCHQDAGIALLVPVLAFSVLWIYESTVVARGMDLPFLPTREDIFRVMKARALRVESNYGSLDMILRDTKLNLRFKIRAGRQLLKDIRAQIAKIEELAQQIKSAARSPKSSHHRSSHQVFFFEIMPESLAKWKLAFEPARKKVEKLERTFSWQRSACTVKSRTAS